jgi:hypothetical protein
MSSASMGLVQYNAAFLTLPLLASELKMRISQNMDLEIHITYYANKVKLTKLFYKELA